MQVTQIIRDDYNGFLADNELDAFTHRLRYLLERPSVVSFAGYSASRDLVRSWGDIAGEVLDRYQHLIDRQHNRLAI